MDMRCLCEGQEVCHSKEYASKLNGADYTEMFLKISKRVGWGFVI